jgi:phosphoribosylformylglycinamidine synthase
LFNAFVQSNMATPRALILRAPGTNCDAETAHAFAVSGADPELWHVNRLLDEPKRLVNFQILCLPGGFSYGDDLSAGRILGSKLSHHLAEPLAEFRDAGKLILGVCNGFQVLLKTDLLSQPDDLGAPVTLAFNDSGHFEARWVRLSASPGSCVFLQGIEELELPVAHAEGRFVTRDDATFDAMERAGQLVLRYCKMQTSDPPWENGKCEMQHESARPSVSRPEPLVPYPANPNGALGDVAGICDATGRVLGLMPHPERFIDPTQHPRWTRRGPREAGDGLRIFQNSVRYFG